MKTLSLITLILFLSSCTKQSTVEKNGTQLEEVIEANEEVINAESFDENSKYGFQLLETSLDTFKILSHSWYFFNCLGEFTTPKELNDYYSNRFELKKETSIVYNDSSIIEPVYRLKMENGFVKFFHDNEENKMQLISGVITEPTIWFENGIKVGLSKNELMKILFERREPKNIRNYKNIQLITALDGLWITMNLEDDKIKKIVIDSNYQLDKK